MSAKKPAAKKPPVKEETKFYVYLGPTVPGKIVERSFYKGTRESVEASLAGVIAEYPEVGTLLIAGDELADARKKIKSGGSHLNSVFNDLAAKLK